MKAKDGVTQMRSKEGMRQPCESEIVDIVIHNDGNKCSEGDRQWLKSIIDGRQRSRQAKIHRVPRILREIEANKRCFDPLMVSIGPYHHGKQELVSMEEHKLRMAGDYADNNQEKLEDLYAKVMGVVKAARECYTDDGLVGRFDDHEFTRMMFVDGCFLIRFIDCYVNGKPEKLRMKSYDAAFVVSDLFLLENQIPFLVLKELMRSTTFKENELKKMFSKFIAQLGGPSPAKIYSETGEGKAHEGEEPAHLLDFIRSQFIDKDKSKRIRVFSPPPSYRSAKELKTVGISFSPSKTPRFTDVTFKDRMFFPASLKLPPIMVDESTKSMLLNMAAYEACPDGPNDFAVSSYIYFMDSLIDHAEDVGELRKKGILVNTLGSDQHVADIFNQIAEHLVVNPDAYAAIEKQIEKHYKNKIKIWLAEWLHTHFSSPWTFLAFFAAIFALVLDVIQTFFKS